MHGISEIGRMHSVDHKGRMQSFVDKVSVTVTVDALMRVLMAEDHVLQRTLLPAIYGYPGMFRDFQAYQA